MDVYANELNISLKSKFPLLPNKVFHSPNMSLLTGQTPVI